MECRNKSQNKSNRHTPRKWWDFFLVINNQTNKERISRAKEVTYDESLEGRRPVGVTSKPSRGRHPHTTCNMSHHYCPSCKGVQQMPLTSPSLGIAMVTSIQRSKASYKISGKGILRILNFKRLISSNLVGHFWVQYWRQSQQPGLEM